MVMQNHYIYALLSNNTYHNATYNLPLGWWKEFKGNFPILNSTDNFYAFPYVNELLKKIIIAFRGSDTFENFIKEDIEIFFNKVPSLFFSKVIPFVEVVNIEVIRQYPDFEISFTGHSLGAVLAELCAAKYSKKAVTFESPGSGSMIVDLALKGQLPLSAPGNAAANIFSYQAAISVINRYNAYLGKRYRIYPELTYPDSPAIRENLAGLLLNDRCDPYDIPTDTNFFRYSYHQHHMNNLLTQFDPGAGVLVYSEYLPSENNGFQYAFNAWKNYDENPYYWDQVIDNIYYPICGQQQTKQAFKEAYIAKWLIRNTNPTQQTGVTIYAPGSAHYPALTIWGATNGKNTLIIGKGNFKVFAYGVNTYELTRDAKVSCDIEQMTLDSNRESNLFIGGQRMQGYALKYNTPSIFKSTLYLSNGLKVPWNRTADETKETYHISIGNSAAISDPDFAVDFPTIRFSNSPSGQFNILAGEAYHYVNLYDYYLLAGSSKGLIYNITNHVDEKGVEHTTLYQQTLLGEVISEEKISDRYHMNECFGGKNESPTILYLHEKDGILHIFSIVECHKEKLPAEFTDRSDTKEASESWQCSDYTDILDNGEVVFSCGGIYRCSERKEFYLYPKFDNFESSFECSDADKKFYPMTSMQYPLKSGYKLVTTNPGFSDDPIFDSFLGKSEIFILDNHGNRILTLISPLSKSHIHSYFPGALLPNDDTLVIGSFRNKKTWVINGYAIYWQTSSLAYFKLIEAMPVSAMQNDALKAIWMTEGFLTCLQGAGAQGIVGAMNEVVNAAATQAGYSDSAAQKASQLFYYISLFCMQFYLQYDQNENVASPEFEDAADNAAKDIFILLMVNMMLSWIKQMLQWASKTCERNQWQQTSEILQQISDVMQYTSYGYHLYKDSVAETTAAVVAGAVTQKVSEKICQRIVASFLKSHQKSLSPRRSSNDMENQPAHKSLFNLENKQQSYRSFSASASSAQEIRIKQERQQSAFVALSIHNKNISSCIPAQVVNQKAENKRVCPVM